VTHFASRDPLAETDRLLVDGTNLLHALSRRPGAMPAAALIGRLRGAIPASISIELVFDGPPEPGLRGERVASGLTVRYGGRRSADEVLIGQVEAVRSSGGPRSTASVLVVSDDHALRTALRERGARTAGSAWLLGRLERRTQASPSVGNRRGPRPAGPGAGAGAGAGAAAPPRSADGHPDGDADDRPGWSPGRGATKKRGNPRRGRPAGGGGGRGSGRMPA
jgi:hypothetical protein